jgi:hypothetical protein
MWQYNSNVCEKFAENIEEEGQYESKGLRDEEVSHVTVKT